MTLTPFDLSHRFRYHDLTFLKTLLNAIELLYSPESSEHTKLVQLSVVHMMLTQHSLFLPTMLTSEEEGAPDIHIKGDHVLCLPHSVAVLPSSFVHTVMQQSASPSVFRG